MGHGENNQVYEPLSTNFNQMLLQKERELQIQLAKQSNWEKHHIVNIFGSSRITYE